MAGEVWNGVATGSPGANLSEEKLQLVQDAGETERARAMALTTPTGKPGGKMPPSPEVTTRSPIFTASGDGK